MSLNLSEEVLNRRVFNQQVFDLHSSEFMLGQTKKYVHPFRRVIDVGAAVGMYSTFWAPRCLRLYAFEAVPPVYNQLKKLEDRFDNVTTFNLAVSDKVGQTDFYVDDKRLSNSGFRDLVGGQKITVETTTIDAQDFENVGFMKIDVEGHELEVLNGAEMTIRMNRPTCMVEVYPKFNNGPVASTFEFFFTRNYKCFYNIRGQGLQPVSDVENGVRVASDEQLIQQHDGDFLFVHKENIDGNLSKK